MRVLNKPYLKRKKACSEKLFLNLVLSLFSLGQVAICGDSDVALPGVDRAFWGDTILIAKKSHVNALTDKTNRKNCTENFYPPTLQNKWNITKSKKMTVKRSLRVFCKTLLSWTKNKIKSSSIKLNYQSSMLVT